MTSTPATVTPISAAKSAGPEPGKGISAEELDRHVAGAGLVDPAAAGHGGYRRPGAGRVSFRIPAGRMPHHRRRGSRQNSAVLQALAYRSVLF
jgi:hypothetical protein